jgi:hypothetical protein
MRDPDSGNSKGYAFINFANFDGSDTALEAMNGQYLCNRPITVSYAFKKEAKGERHGSAAERLLAAQNPLSHSDKPHTLFVFLIQQILFLKSFRYFRFADQPQFAPAPPVPPPVNPFPMASWLPYGALGGLPIPPGLPGLPPPPPPFTMVCFFDNNKTIVNFHLVVFSKCHVHQWLQHQHQLHHLYVLFDLMNQFLIDFLLASTSSTPTKSTTTTSTTHDAINIYFSFMIS